MASRPPRQILPKGVVTTPAGAGEIIYVINNSSEGPGQMNTDSRLLKRSLNNGGGKIGSGRPLHIRTDLLPTGLVEDVSCGGREGEVVEEEVVGGEVDYDGEQAGGAAEITFIEEGEGHKTEEETVTVYEVVADEECHEEEWVEEVQLESGEVNRDTGAGVVEEMVFEEEGVEEGEQVIYVTDDGHPVEGDVTFMQVGGPDVASEETIETSVIVEVDEVVGGEEEGWRETNTATPLSTDHCYTFKRGIRPKDLDKAKTKAAMLGEGSPGQQYTYILPKNPTTQIIFPNQATFATSTRMLDPKPTSSPSSVSRQPRCSKHRWLWQFMKELLLVGDSALQWVNQREGSFLLRDQDGLAVKWECYKKLHKMKAQVWRQMRYYFGWMEENKIVRPVPDTTDRFQFHEKFFREKFLPYKFRPHANLEEIARMAEQLDPNTDILSRYRSGLKEKVYCVRGCGSQFINREACSRHEGVCTFGLAPS